MADRRVTRRWQAAAVLAPVAALLTLVFLSGHHALFDLHVYNGAVRWFTSGQPLYDYGRGRKHYGFTYPPFALLPMLPLALLPFLGAALLLSAATAAVITVGTALLVAPVARRRGWPVACVVSVAVSAVCLLEPIRDAMGFGQVDVLLAGLVLADVAGIGRGRRWAGVGVGLATAVKLTPGIFVVLLLLARRWREAAVATGTAAASTLLAAVVAPGTSVQYWTHTLFQTDRVGSQDSSLNQALSGAVTRAVDLRHPPLAPWLLLVLAVGALGLVRARRAFADGDVLMAFTLAGLTGGLISPISWVHHLFWVVPAVLLTADAALRRGSRRLALLAAGVWALFASSLPDHVSNPPGHHLSGGFPGWVMESAYVLAMVLLVAVLPWRRRQGPPARPARTANRSR